jgi:hypothetical protein
VSYLLSDNFLREYRRTAAFDLLKHSNYGQNTALETQVKRDHLLGSTEKIRKIATVNRSHETAIVDSHALHECLTFQGYKVTFSRLIRPSLAHSCTQNSNFPIVRRLNSNSAVSVVWVLSGHIPAQWRPANVVHVCTTIW